MCLLNQPVQEQDPATSCYGNIAQSSGLFEVGFPARPTKKLPLSKFADLSGKGLSSYGAKKRAFLHVKSLPPELMDGGLPLLKTRSFPSPVKPATRSLT